MTKAELLRFLEFFFLAWVMGCLAITARITSALSRNPTPPLDPEDRRLWEANRRWLWIAELSAAPVLASITAVATFYTEGNWLVACIGGLITGALGFPFLVRALKTIIDRRYDLREDQ